MSALVFSLLGEIWPYLVLIAGGLLWGLKERRAGAASVRAQQDKVRAKAIKDKKELDDEIAGLGPADLDTRFKRWMQNDR